MNEPECYRCQKATNCERKRWRISDWPNGCSERITEAGADWKELSEVDQQKWIAGKQ